MPQDKFLITEMLTKRGILVDNKLITNSLSFYSYPSVNELRQINVEEVTDSREKITSNERGLLIGQLPRGFDRSYILFILSKMFNDTNLFTCYSKGFSYNHLSKTSDYCFINANANHVEILLRYHRALRPDVNGVWVAHNSEGLEILDHIEKEIRMNPRISKTYKLDYDYCKYFAISGISIEVQKNFRSQNSNYSQPQRVTNEFEQVSQELTTVLLSLKDLPSNVTDMVLSRANEITEQLQNLSNKKSFKF